MTFSLITINLNNKIGLEKTINSVLNQSYTNYEYIIIDGGSTDGSEEIIKTNSSKFTYSVSEKDNGVYHAMNKGIAKASGNYVLFLNSGDTLNNEHTLREIIAQDLTTDIVYGNMIYVHGLEENLMIPPAQLEFKYLLNQYLPHPATFIKKETLIKLGGFDEELKIVSDWKFFLQAICKHQVTYQYFNVTVSKFQHGGLSSQPSAYQLSLQEKKKVLTENNNYFKTKYPKAIELFNQQNTSKLTKLKIALKGLLGLHK